MSELYRVFHKGVAGQRTNSMYRADDSFLEKVSNIIERSPGSDFYESIYLYEPKHLDILKSTKSLAGIQDVKTNRVVLDFDSEDNVELAKADAVMAYDRMMVAVPNPEENIRIFFSGGKGFHLEVHIDSFIDRAQFENIIDGLAGDLTTFDTKVKDQQRLFRFPLTRNPNTKQYKIPLTQAQLRGLTVDEIRNLSKSQDHTQFYDLMNSYTTTELPVAFKELKKRTKKETKAVTLSTQADRPDMSRKPKHLTAAKFALQEGYFDEGERNEACMILATTYKYLNYDDEHTYNIIKATLRKRSKRLGLGDYDKGELWRTIISPVFSPTWKGGTYSEEDGLLKRTIERYDLDKVDITNVGLVSLNSMAAHFKNFAQNIEANTIKLGIDEIDRKVRITTGMLVAFLAAPGAGKSSAAFGILNTLSNSGEKAIFFSMDMGADQVFQRLIQRHTKHQSEQILKAYENDEYLVTDDYAEKLANNYKNIKFCFKTSLTPEAIRAVVEQEFQSTGSYPKMILLDYLECIQTGSSDPTQSKAIAALALKDIANEFGINVFLLTQPTKLAGGPAGELNSYTQIKGSGVVGEQATVVLTMSRPGFDPKNPDDDNYVTINVVKNRMGPLSSTDLHWDGLTGHIRSLSGEEEKDLNALRAAVAMEKEEKELY
jgi:hypothetical protein